MMGLFGGNKKTKNIVAISPPKSMNTNESLAKLGIGSPVSGQKDSFIKEDS